MPALNYFNGIIYQVDNTISGYHYIIFLKSLNSLCFLFMPTKQLDTSLISDESILANIYRAFPMCQEYAADIDVILSDFKSLTKQKVLSIDLGCAPQWNAIFGGLKSDFH